MQQERKDTLPRANIMGLVSMWLAKPSASQGVGTYTEFNLISQKKQLRLLGALMLPRLYL